jgi:hypothetical protein
MPTSLSPFGRQSVVLTLLFPAWSFPVCEFFEQTVFGGVFFAIIVCHFSTIAGVTAVARMFF